jgi:hypothetical protein
MPSPVGVVLTRLHRSKGPHHRAKGEEEGREEDDEHRIMVVTGSVGALMICRMARIHWSKGPTPRTTGASDRVIPTVITDLANPSRTTTV